MIKKIAILEPGAWGTALGLILSRNELPLRGSSFGGESRRKKEVNFWYHNADLALKIDKERENSRLPGAKIPKEILIFSDLIKALEGADLIIIASPSFHFRDTVNRLTGIKKLPPILGIAKGLEKETLKFPSQIIEEILGKVPYAHLSGPGFAKEVAQGKPTKEVIACKDEALLEELRETFQVNPLDVSVTTDLIGVELAGAMKNSLAIGISLVEASVKGKELELIKEEMIAVGLEEMAEMGEKMGAKKETFFGPAGLGDLILTSTNSLSRNFQFGQKLYYDGEQIREDIMKDKITVEGFNNAFALHKLAKNYNLNLPILEETYKVIYEKASPKETVENIINLVK